MKSKPKVSIVPKKLLKEVAAERAAILKRKDIPVRERIRMVRKIEQ